MSHDTDVMLITLTFTTLWVSSADIFSILLVFEKKKTFLSRIGHRVYSVCTLCHSRFFYHRVKLNN